MVVQGILSWKMIDFVSFFQSVEDYLEDILPHYIPKDEIKIMYIGSLANAVGTICAKFSDLEETRIKENSELREHFGILYSALSDAISKIEGKQYTGIANDLLLFYNQITLINDLLSKVWAKTKTE
jgi:phosphate uptake regulator